MKDYSINNFSFNLNKLIVQFSDSVCTFTSNYPIFININVSTSCSNCIIKVHSGLHDMSNMLNIFYKATIDMTNINGAVILKL